MKKFWKDFLLRGLIACAGGPLVLAVIYGILGATGQVVTVSAGTVCTGIISVIIMAFIAAGITAIYQTERLPLSLQILVHAGVLYADYLIMYLLNSWMQKNWKAIGIFSAIFAVGFALIWLCVWLFERKKIARLNSHLPKA